MRAVIDEQIRQSNTGEHPEEELGDADGERVETMSAIPSVYDPLSAAHRKCEEQKRENEAEVCWDLGTVG